MNYLDKSLNHINLIKNKIKNKLHSSKIKNKINKNNFKKIIYKKKKTCSRKKKKNQCAKAIHCFARNETVLSSVCFSFC